MWTLGNNHVSQYLPHKRCNTAFRTQRLHRDDLVVMEDHENDEKVYRRAYDRISPKPGRRVSNSCRLMTVPCPTAKSASYGTGTSTVGTVLVPGGSTVLVPVPGRRLHDHHHQSKSPIPFQYLVPVSTAIVLLGPTYCCIMRSTSFFLPALVLQYGTYIPVLCPTASKKIDNVRIEVWTLLEN
jgi:hypothetical protein